MWMFEPECAMIDSAGHFVPVTEEMYGTERTVELFVQD